MSQQQTGTVPARRFGPQQQRNAKVTAVHVWAWGIDAMQAVERNDTDRVAELAAAIGNAAEELAALARRASR